MHKTKTKGDLAVAKAISDLIEKGYEVLQPFSEHLPFDLVVYKDNKFIRIQVKHSKDGVVKNHSGWVSKSQNHIKTYNIKDFDYYALYLVRKDKLIYLPSNMGGKQIRLQLPKRNAPFYWWEDYINLSYVIKNGVQTHTLKDFGLLSDFTKRNYTPRPNTRKYVRPDADTLARLISEKPLTHIAKDYNVSDNTIKDWADKYGLLRPSKGYWQKLKAKICKVTST